MKPTIFIVENSRAFTGAFKAIFNSCSELSEDYNFIFIVPARSSNRDILRVSGFMVFELPFVELSRRPKDIILYIPFLLLNAIRLFVLVRRYNVRIVHVNDIYNLVPIVTKILISVKVITHIRLVPESIPKPVWKLWFSIVSTFSDSLVCVSGLVKGQANHKKAILIYDYVKWNLNYKSAQIRSRAAKILYVGNYIRGKGQDLAIESFYRAYKRDNSLRLKFIGDDMGLAKNRHYKQELMNRVIALNIKEVVIFEGFVSEIEQEMREADIVLNLSEFESLSFVCIEALMIGTPLICTNSGGPGEYIQDGENGYLISERNPVKIADAIIDLCASLEKRQKFSAKGVETIRIFFSRSKTVELLDRLYQNVLSARV